MKVSRVYEFPREAVFRMWTDPKRLGEWWGPAGCVTVRSDIDPRPGGAMRVDQRHPDGHVHSFRATIEKVAVPELLVYRSVSAGTADFAPWEALDTITFEEIGPSRTRLTAVTKVIAGPQRERRSLLGAYAGGWGEALDKLQKALR